MRHFGVKTVILLKKNLLSGADQIDNSDVKKNIDQDRLMYLYMKKVAEFKLFIAY